MPAQRAPPPPPRSFIFPENYTGLSLPSFFQMSFGVPLSNFEKGKNCGEPRCDGRERACSPRWGGTAPWCPTWNCTHGASTDQRLQTLPEWKLELGRRVLGPLRSQVLLRKPLATTVARGPHSTLGFADWTYRTWLSQPRVFVECETPSGSVGPNKGVGMPAGALRTNPLCQ